MATVGSQRWSAAPRQRSAVSRIWRGARFARGLKKSCLTTGSDAATVLAGARTSWPGVTLVRSQAPVEARTLAEREHFQRCGSHGGHADGTSQAWTKAGRHSVAAAPKISCCCCSPIAARRTLENSRRSARRSSAPCGTASGPVARVTRRSSSARDIGGLPFVTRLPRTIHDNQGVSP